jgi:putative sigma-54 modulation protein
MMNLNLTGHHVEITPAIRDYVTTKMDKIKRHFDNVIDVNVTLSVEKLKQNAEANVHVRGKDIFVETNSANMYVSIDNLVDKLDRKILKYKGKNVAHRNSSAFKTHESEQSD